MKRNRINWLIMLLVILMSTIVVTNKVEAADNQLEIPYDVRANLSDNQINQQVSYFDVLVQPGEKQDFSIKVRNRSDHTIKVTLTPYTARTSSEGIVDYEGADVPLTTNIPASFEKIISKKQTVTLSKYDQKDVIFTMEAPKKAFNGVLLGGFYIQEEKKPNTKEQKNSEKKETGIVIHNTVSNTIGAVVRNNKEEVNESFSLNEVKVANDSGDFSLRLGLANQASKIITAYSLEGTITDKEGKQVAKFERDTFDMAPNSIFQSFEKVNADDFVTENYTVNLRIFNEDKSKHWDLNQSFDITRKDRRKVMKETGIKVTNNWNQLIIIAAAITMLVLLVAIIIVWRRKKKA